MEFDETRMSADQWLRKYSDTHTEIEALTAFQKSKAVKVPENKSIYSNSKIPGKKLIEKDCWEKREQKTRQLFYDLLEVRANELLDKKEFPVTHLVQMIGKLLPQKVEQKNENVHSFSEAMLKAKLELENPTTIDAEGNLIE